MASTLCQKRFSKKKKNKNKNKNKTKQNKKQKTKTFFVKKLKISCSLDHTILFKFHQHVVQNTNNVWRDFDFQCRH